MMPGRAALQIYQGGSKTIRITWKSATGAVRDLTGCTFRCTGKAAKNDTATTFNLTTANAGVEYVTIDGVKKIQLNFTKEVTTAIPGASGVWELFVIFQNGEEKPILAHIYNCERRVASPNV